MKADEPCKCHIVLLLLGPRLVLTRGNYPIGALELEVADEHVYMPLIKLDLPPRLGAPDDSIEESTLRAVYHDLAVGGGGGQCTRATSPLATNAGSRWADT